MGARQPHPHTPESLQVFIDQLERAAAGLTVIQGKMRDRHVDELGIWNHKEFLKALDKMDAFVSAANKAWVESQIQPPNGQPKK